MRAVPLGCKNAALKHVLSFRRQVHMFLSSPERTLEASFRVVHGEGSFMVYASTESMKCFECGDLDHKRFACPHKDSTLQRVSTASTGENTFEHRASNTETQRSEEQDKHARDETVKQQEVSEANTNIVDMEKPGCSNVDDKVVSEGDDIDQSDVENLSKVKGAVENMVDELENLSQCTEDGMKEDEQWTDTSKGGEKDLYTLEQINSFLDNTKGRAGIEISDYFPDIDKFISSVMWARKRSSYNELSTKKVPP